MDPIQRLFSEDGPCTRPFTPPPPPPPSPGTQELSQFCVQVFFDMWWTHWYTIFKISSGQTRYKALKGTVPPKLLNLGQMTSWTSCQLSFLFSTYCFYHLWGCLKIKQCIMDNVIRSSNRRQPECVFKDTSNLSNVCFPKTAYFFWTLAVPGNCFHFCSTSVLVIRCTGARQLTSSEHSQSQGIVFISARDPFWWLGVLVQVLKDSSMPDQSYIP